MIGTNYKFQDPNIFFTKPVEQEEQKSNTSSVVSSVPQKIVNIILLPFQLSAKGIYWVLCKIKNVFTSIFSCCFPASTDTSQNKPRPFIHNNNVNNNNANCKQNSKVGAQYPTGKDGSYTHDDLKKVWENTNKVIWDGYYVNFKGNQKDIGRALKVAIENTALVNYKSKKYLPKNNYKTEISLCNVDAVQKAVELSKDSVALLNPASSTSPGGGYLDGLRAMEEDICRRSGLAWCLDRKHRAQKTNFYPFKNREELIYSPSVPIFRDGRDNNYSFLPGPKKISIISSAAIDINPQHKKSRPKNFIKDTESIIYNHIATAANKGHNVLVLTAFGCGAFANPPEEIAQLYKKVIEENFKGVFKKIVFAIIDDHNANKAHNPKGNYEVFKKTILQMGGKIE